MKKFLLSALLMTSMFAAASSDPLSDDDSDEFRGEKRGAFKATPPAEVKVEEIHSSLGTLRFSGGKVFSFQEVGGGT